MIRRVASVLFAVLVTILQLEPPVAGWREDL